MHYFILFFIQIYIYIERALHNLVVVLGNQLVHERDVLLFGLFLGQGALQLIPGIPLLSVLDVENTRSLHIHVPDSGLLVQTVQLQ